MVTDNAKNMRKTGSLLEIKYPHMCSYGCMAYTFHLLCSDIIKTDSVDEIIHRAKTIIKTITASQLISAHFAEIKSALSLSAFLSLPVVTRWGSHVKCLEDHLKYKFVLKRLCICEDVSIQNKLEAIKDIILVENETNKFWSNVTEIKDLLKPITESITVLESDCPRIHLVCQMFNKIKVKTIFLQIWIFLLLL
ncbi:hypothetical protein NQ314_018958 [Rhamnusium bicolor]|uniref:DUF659 domain-containing protein n=1 Tax=Rhamnusium bicolor TaxID=1586634 RepID=A0AAV8WQ77_9CUCU|nr:hypothetical protein NQ314_018958 [Rhamnusium bicolor]